MRIVNSILSELALVLLLSLAGCSQAVNGKRVGSLPSAKEAETKVTDRDSKADISSTAQVRVSYSLVQDQVTLHEPVFLTFIVENETSQPILIDLGADRKEVFEFTIENPDGSRSDVKPKIPESSYGIGRVTVQQSQTYKQRLLLNEWYDFGVPGQYEINTRLVKPHPTPRGFDVYNIYETPESQVKLGVGPRDPIRLKEICSDLAEEVIKAPTVNDATDPAETLSYIIDPIAVPYLVNVLKSNRLMEERAIAGLERIGTDEAIRALEAASKSKNTNSVLFAKRALDKLGRSPKSRDK